MYDDEYGGDQTVRVELGDTVVAQLVLDGRETDYSIELPVGRPPSEQSACSILTSTVNFNTSDEVELTTKPLITLDRMNEDYAQAGIRFELGTTASFSTTAGIETLAVSHFGSGLARSTSINIDLVVDADTISSFSSAQGGNRFANLIDNAVSDLNARAGRALVHSYRHWDPHVETDNYETYVLVFSGYDSLRISEITSSSNSLLIQSPLLNYKSEWNLLERHLISIENRDSSLSTVDYFVAPNKYMRSRNGEAVSDIYAEYLPGLQNTGFIVESAANGDDRSYPFTAGHEMGHILMDYYFPGATQGHSSNTENLMFGYAALDELENLRARKRLTPEQIDDMRKDSGPDTTPPLLQRKAMRQP